MDKKESLKDIKAKELIPRIIITTISIAMIAINYNLFFLRNDIVSGGASGIATILNELIGINPATFILAINILLVIISYFTLGKITTGRTIIGSILYPLFISLTSPLCDILAKHIVFNEFIIIVIVSGFIYGFFNGMIYKMGYSTGGVDSLIMIINKYLKISSGTASFLVNIIILTIGAFVFGINKAVYGVLIVIMNTYLINKIQLGISNAKMFYIATKKPEEIKQLINEMNTGCTLMKTEGGHSKERNNMIMCVVPTTSYYMFRKSVMNIDNDAFIIINDCYEVYGGQLKTMFPFI